MVRKTAQVCIDAAPAEVWAYLARLEDVALWADGVLHAACPPGHTAGVGAERVCALKGNQTIRERWVEWQEGVSYAYEATGMPGVSYARNHWSLVPAAAGRTLLISQSEIKLRGGWFGRLFEPILQWQVSRIIDSGLGGFKYFVEHGAPYAGPPTRLPAPRTC